MQEQKEFSTVLFGFEKKAVLDYIFEQDKEAREALDELARRNTDLDDRANDLIAQMQEINAQFDALKEVNEKEHIRFNEQEKETARLRDRVAKAAAQLREKENSLQLQMELNKRMQARLSEQEAEITSLREQLKEAENKAKLFACCQDDFNSLRKDLDEIRGQFTKRLEAFEKEFDRLERSVPCGKGKIADPAPEAPRAQKVLPRLLGSTPTSAESDPDRKAAMAARRRFTKILDEWK